jgi:hypothetical protein
MFEKKFRVRISHFAEDKYTVDYTYYRFIPIYKSINFWFDCGMRGNLESWSTDLFEIKEAEEFAANLKSIEDVNEYYRKENIKRTEFYKKKNEFQKYNIPYKSKQIL